MSRLHYPRALALLVVVLGVSLGVAAAAQAVTAAGATPDASSAKPFKASSDSGVLYDWSDSESDANFPSGCIENGCYSGWDACTYSQVIGDFNANLQQYTVPGCVPAQTPWISTPHSTTQGWAIYCPANAPYYWRSFQGQTIQWWNDGTGNMKALLEVAGEQREGPNPTGKIDWSMFNISAIHSHHWGFIVGCSTMSSGSTAIYQQPAYSHGQGPSACPQNWPVSCGAGVGAPTPRPRMIKGPARRITRTSSRRYSVTREVDLRRGRVATYSLSCRRGYRRVRQDWAVGWYTNTPPSRRKGRTHERVTAEGRRSFSVRVRANGRVRRGTARLQMQLGCRR